MPSLNVLLFFLAVGTAVSLVSISLGALGGLAGALFPQRVARAQESWTASSFRLGLLHALGLLVLLRVGERHKLVQLVALAWLAFSCACILLGLASLVRKVAAQLFPQLPRWRAFLLAGATIAWSCAFPLAGWFVLSFALLCTGYAAGLAGWIRRSGSRTEPLASPRIPAEVSEPAPQEIESHGGA